MCFCSEVEDAGAYRVCLFLGEVAVFCDVFEEEFVYEVYLVLEELFVFVSEFSKGASEFFVLASTYFLVGDVVVVDELVK